jgi:sugar phosphate isomerase/epimerase
MSAAPFTRRAFIAASMTAPFLRGAYKSLPVGLELFSVRGELMKDAAATVLAVGKMGYKIVEFYAPYMQWTPAQAKDMRKVLDESGLECRSTHNGPDSFAANADKAIELNQIIGSKTIVMASPGGPPPKTADDWKRVGGVLASAVPKFKAAGLRAGYHNHGPEWTAVDGQKPMEILAANTPAELTLQLDVGTCVAAGSDPAAWIRSNPGRIRSIHCKDWGAPVGSDKDRGYRVLFGEGDSPWSKIFEAAESVGGVEYYLIEQEGSRFPELETADKCLATWRKMRA